MLRQKASKRVAGPTSFMTVLDTFSIDAQIFTSSKA
jgi:hypothetical protein